MKGSVGEREGERWTEWEIIKWMKCRVVKVLVVS